MAPDAAGPSRQASHAGSWYSSRRDQLDSQLAGWLGKVPSQLDGGFDVPVPMLKAIIAPHAGYSYSGPAAAYAYRAIDPSKFKRVFVLGPSHHAYLPSCALSTCSTYETPLGDLPVDQEAVKELRATGEFSDMKLAVDEDEHSLEMHLPYIRKVFHGQDIRIVPILVGATKPDTEKRFGKLLAPYLADKETLFVISSDFCHWGTRFNYTFYRSETGEAQQLSRRGPQPTAETPIHSSIEVLDKDGMSTITTGDPASAHEAFTAYLAKTHNTICGRHPIGVLLSTLASLPGQPETRVNFVRYEQSSACKRLEDSSVSYASAIVRVLS